MSPILHLNRHSLDFKYFHKVGIASGLVKLVGAYKGAKHLDWEVSLGQYIVTSFLWRRRDEIN